MAEFQSPRRWGGVGLQSEVLKGVTLTQSVSIPSEVGRGRAHKTVSRTLTTNHMFQSPRRWGGVGLEERAAFKAESEELSFNPLGGGAGSGSASSKLALLAVCARFNPLGGGAGSGSQNDVASFDGKSYGFNPLGGGAGSGSAVAATTGPT